MVTEVSSPVEIVQEFISMQNTLREAAERLQPTNGVINEKLIVANAAADKAIAQLMSELSNFGDSVNASVKKEKEFYDSWNEVVNRLDTLSDVEKIAVFQKMEADLHAIYLRVLHDEKELPESINEVLQAQAAELESGLVK